MTPLETIIRREITLNGPMTLHDFMALCLAHPEHGYYTTRDPLGASGDFTTAPEISQMFGEMIGLALAETWAGAGRPTPFRLVELGPGRGQLAADALRAARALPGFVDAADAWLVEISPRLRAEQKRRVPGASWAARLDDVPDGPLFLIANEFFDALPVRQYVMTSNGWAERMVGLSGDTLAAGLRHTRLPLGAAPEGAIRERNPGSAAIAGALGARIARDGGAAIIIDYGYGETSPMGADTVQALRSHRYADPLSDPGLADLTAHVDFEALAAAAGSAGAAASALVPQGEWLARLGIGARAEALARARPDQAETIAAALHRLTDPAEMGTLFKALAIFPPGSPPPPGFETESAS
ncbi:class I SAM-dependent methyltransferase [Pikeienuella piscinae]|uniref:Class I SAM-dependent methyltransferase n=1 Tax=Pikeienuella piscinae TaxID=2748098 RepID=A0A7M3T723_9RHOB|nr:SAM-dependent methyltransferase [Pikeienuella piscinae]QIE57804.1 class I SAM-dependent methyltransferase [Pikeienuella piscinae]